MIRRFYQSLFFSRRFYWAFAVIIVLMVMAYSSALLLLTARVMLAVLALTVLVDFLLLYTKSGVHAERRTAERFSNGNDNRVELDLHNQYGFRVRIKTIDEIPVQFQQRDFVLHATLKTGERTTLSYYLRPVERGEYIFQDINVFVQSPLSLITRRFRFAARCMVKVYPSYFSLKKFDLLAHSSHLTETGTKRIRKIGHSLEFEQIREYVTGDDIRTINWKATARKAGQLMVNNYVDERSQQVYCIIDKGRVMKMPFDGLTLLDHAINATLILSRVALLKQDRVGLVCFDEQMGQLIPAERRGAQMNTILETLYNQQTRFLESDFEKLYTLVHTKINQRSLIVFFTNFESMSGLQRQLPYLRAIARTHLLLTVFFENTALTELTAAPAESVESLYIRTIAEKFVHEKRLMVRELQQHGIATILTAPENLTVDTVNRYLEIKARQVL